MTKGFFKQIYAHNLLLYKLNIHNQTDLNIKVHNNLLLLVNLCLNQKFLIHEFVDLVLIM